MSDKELEPAAYLTMNTSNGLYYPWWVEDPETREEDLKRAKEKEDVTVKKLYTASDIREMLSQALMETESYCEAVENGAEKTCRERDALSYCARCSAVNDISKLLPKLRRIDGVSAEKEGDTTE